MTGSHHNTGVWAIQSKHSSACKIKPEAFWHRLESRRRIVLYDPVSGDSLVGEVVYLWGWCKVKLVELTNTRWCVSWYSFLWKGVSLLNYWYCRLCTQTLPHTFIFIDSASSPCLCVFCDTFFPGQQPPLRSCCWDSVFTEQRGQLPANRLEICEKMWSQNVLELLLW